MMLDPINLFDFEARAKLALPNHIWDFIEAGASDEITTGRNRRALDAVALRPRYLVDVWGPGHVNDRAGSQDQPSRDAGPRRRTGLRTP